MIHICPNYEFAICPGMHIPDDMRVGYKEMSENGKWRFILDEGIIYSDSPKFKNI